MTPNVVEFGSIGDASAIVRALSAGSVVVLRASPKSELLTLVSSIGAIVSHKHSGEDGFVTVEDGRSQGVRRPQSTPTTQSPHTDGCFLGSPPGVVALHCATTPAAGGGSTFTSAAALLAALTARFSPGEVAPLRDDAYRIDRGTTSLLRPVFELHKGRVRCLFSAHEFNRVKPSVSAIPAFDFMREFVRDPANQTTVELEVDDTALVNNTATLHGRMGWRVTAERRRRVERAWFNGGKVRTGFEIQDAAASTFLTRVTGEVNGELQCT